MFHGFQFNENFRRQIGAIWPNNGLGYRIDCKMSKKAGSLSCSNTGPVLRCLTSTTFTVPSLDTIFGIKSRITSTSRMWRILCEYQPSLGLGNLPAKLLRRLDPFLDYFLCIVNSLFICRTIRHTYWQFWNFRNERLVFMAPINNHFITYAVAAIESQRATVHRPIEKKNRS
jgi:hypothetical protein